MKKIAIALALSASMALIACGEEAKKEEPKKAAAKPAAKEAKKAEAKDEAKKAEYHAKMKKDLEQNCQLKLAALTGSKEDKEKSKAFNAEFQDKYKKTPAANIKAFKAEIKACVDLKAAKDAKKENKAKK